MYEITTNLSLYKKRQKIYLSYKSRDIKKRYQKNAPTVKIDI